jgi:hypothetical protein
MPLFNDYLAAKNERIRKRKDIKISKDIICMAENVTACYHLRVAQIPHTPPGLHSRIACGTVLPPARVACVTQTVRG